MYEDPEMSEMVGALRKIVDMKSNENGKKQASAERLQTESVVTRLL